MLRYHVDGMTCGHCVQAITRAVTEMAPTATVQVDLSTKQVLVGGVSDPEAAATAIAAAGYAVTPLA